MGLEVIGTTFKSSGVKFYGQISSFLRIKLVFIVKVWCLGTRILHLLVSTILRLKVLTVILAEICFIQLLWWKSVAFCLEELTDEKVGKGR